MRKPSRVKNLQKMNIWLETSRRKKKKNHGKDTALEGFTSENQIHSYTLRSTCIQNDDVTSMAGGEEWI